jgi:hypothetical protein
VFLFLSLLSTMKDIHYILIHFFYVSFDEVKIVLDLKRFSIFTQPNVCHTFCGGKI